MALSAANNSKNGFYDSTEGKAFVDSKVPRYPYSSYATPPELAGNRPIHIPTYGGAAEHLIVLDKNWAILVVNKMADLYDQINTLSSGALETQTSTWMASLPDNPNYTARTNMWAQRDTYIGSARNTIERPFKNTTYYSITSTDDTNYTSAQDPAQADYIHVNKGGDRTKDTFLRDRAGTVTFGNYEVTLAYGTFANDYCLYCYVNFPTSLVDGKTYTITADDGSSATFLFDLDSTVSRAIKVNQVGYLPNAGTKKAYLGAYLYQFGPLDLSHATTFEVVNTSTGATALSGSVTLIEADPQFNPPTDTDSMYGEDVYEIDISALTATGEFYIKVPGVGRSWPFKHISTAYTQAFYDLARGYYHHRGNLEKTTRYTDWPTREASRGPFWYESDYIQMPLHATNAAPVDDTGGHSATDVLSQTDTTGTGTGFSLTVDTDNLSGGQVISLQTEANYDNSPTSEGTFAGGSGHAIDDVIEVTGGATVLVENVSAGAVTEFTVSSQNYDVFDVYGGSTDRSSPTTAAPGGWHDASDYDSRDFHLVAVFDMLYAFLWNSSNIKDDQLNIPESGDGVPDLLSEARYCLEVFRLSQDGNGGISGILEAWTQPDVTGVIQGNNPPGVNKVDYSFSKRTRYASLQFAAAAAMYSQLVAPYDASDAATYQTAAINAYTFGTTGGNSLGTTSIKWADNRGAGATSAHIWTELDSYSDPYLMHAKCRLYILTGTSTYITDSPSVSTLAATVQNPYTSTWNRKDLSPYIWYSVIEAQEAGATSLNSLATTWRTWFTDDADALLADLTDAPYEMTYDRAVKTNLAFGLANPTVHNRGLFIAHQIDDTAGYRDAAIQNMDFALGCNPMGISWVTGLGYVYPIEVQNLHSRDDQIDDPFPGICVYGVDGSPIYLKFRAWSVTNDQPAFVSPTDDGAITSITQTGGTATVTTTNPHGLSSGDLVHIEGANEDEYNKGYDNLTAHASITVTGASTFTYAVDSGAASPATGTIIWRHGYINDASQYAAPLWRRWMCHPYSNVVQCEYTVFETNANMMLTAAMLAVDEPIVRHRPRDPNYLYGYWYMV